MAGRHRHLVTTTVGIDDDRKHGLEAVSNATKVPVAALIREGINLLLERERSVGGLLDGAPPPAPRVSIFEEMAKEIESLATLPVGSHDELRAYRIGLSDAAKIVRARSRSLSKSLLHKR